MQIYFIDVNHQDIGDFATSKDQSKVIEDARELMQRDKLDLYKLLSNEAVKTQLLRYLDDFSETYVPSVLALVQLENERGDQEIDLGEGLKVQVPKNTFP